MLNAQHNARQFVRFPRLRLIREFLRARLEVRRRASCDLRSKYCFNSALNYSRLWASNFGIKLYGQNAFL